MINVDKGPRLFPPRLDTTMMFFCMLYLPCVCQVCTRKSQCIVEIIHLTDYNFDHGLNIYLESHIMSKHLHLTFPLSLAYLA